MKIKKFDEKKIFVTGVSGCGKTFFATNYAEQFTTTYFSFDTTWNYTNSDIEEYQKIINMYPSEFITDAIPYTMINNKLSFLDYYEENKNDIKIVCVCCTNQEEYDRRIEQKSFKDKNDAYNQFYDFYFKTLKNYLGLNIEYYDTFINKFITEKELYRKIDWVVKYNLKSYIDIQEYDKYYQDVESINLLGYSQSSKTWENIKNLVDWKEKKVADLGCFHCYFAIKAAKEGAYVTGMDINDNVLRTAKYINQSEGNIIYLKKWSGGEEVSSHYDITLALNIIHHFPDIKKGLQNIQSKIVIFETNKNLVDLIKENFNIIKEIESHRVDANGNIRIILLCEKNK